MLYKFTCSCHSYTVRRSNHGLIRSNYINMEVQGTPVYRTLQDYINPNYLDGFHCTSPSTNALQVGVGKPTICQSMAEKCRFLTASTACTKLEAHWEAPTVAWTVWQLHRFKRRLSLTALFSKDGQSRIFLHTCLGTHFCSSRMSKRKLTETSNYRRTQPNMITNWICWETS